MEILKVITIGAIWCWIFFIILNAKRLIKYFKENQDKFLDKVTMKSLAGWIFYFMGCLSGMAALIWWTYILIK